MFSVCWSWSFRFQISLQLLFLPACCLWAYLSSFSKKSLHLAVPSTATTKLHWSPTGALVQRREEEQQGQSNLLSSLSRSLVWSHTPHFPSVSHPAFSPGLSCLSWLPHFQTIFLKPYQLWRCAQVGFPPPSWDQVWESSSGSSSSPPSCTCHTFESSRRMSGASLSTMTSPHLPGETRDSLKSQELLPLTQFSTKNAKRALTRLWLWRILIQIATPGFLRWCTWGVSLPSGCSHLTRPLVSFHLSSFFVCKYENSYSPDLCILELNPENQIYF